MSDMNEFIADIYGEDFLGRSRSIEHRAVEARKSNGGKPVGAYTSTVNDPTFKTLSEAKKLMVK